MSTIVLHRSSCLSRHLALDTRASVSILGVSALPVIIGIAALSVELGQGYQAKITYQGIADVAALAAANAYASSKSDAILTATATNVANMNGVASSNVAVTHLTNYSASVSDAVQVVLTRTVPVFFGQVLRTQASYTVKVVSVASLASSSTPACIIALSSTDSGVTLSGGTRLSAPQCAIASNSMVSVTGGSTISAKSLLSSGSVGIDGGSSISADPTIYGSSLNVAAGSSITGSQTRKSNNTADPLAGNASIAAAQALIGTYTPPVAPSVPVGADMAPGWYPAVMTFQGHTGTLTGSTWTFPPGIYNFRNLNTGSLTINIQGPSTVTISGSLTVGGGGRLIIGDGPVTINAPINLSGGTSLTLGAGRHYLGAITVGGGSTVTLGAGDLDVNGAIAISGGGSTMVVGAGNVAIGRDSASPPNAIVLSGGSVLTFGNGTFSANGAIITSGGSTITFGQTANHLINGNLSLNGSSTFGAGLYTINGGFTNNTGGTMAGSNVSFVMAGTLNVAGGTSVNLSAPGSGSASGIPDVLFVTKSTSATILGGGTQDVFSGAVYVPNSDFQMSGGAGATGGCFMIVAKTVTLASGPSAATMCSSLSSASSTSSSVTLIK
ncbi:pilus assembly protein TadG-related protein [Novosphingobium sp. KACC 22771]|uniref:pilus assembly protein TadG-related protein n=1 Tax=Novosphingobium sp. KACC 22771 TaxID=3025670 RepID=UPI0023652B68|nr:pilus assembly protein TadG-related protein [Novosphingobium sp. KACC 22771]WDF71345.1 hypothetical protein PQ467_11005 [Novosphingobium sp. KACC 22771]